MNNIKLYIFALSLSGLYLNSCTADFLDVESKTESTTDNFYKTESDAWRALIGCYDGWQVTSSSCKDFAFNYASMIMSDECFGGTGISDARNTQVIDRFDISQSPSYLNLYETEWKNYYAAVYRCNELLANSEQIEWSSEETKGLYLGECRAIRALCYFDMVRLWGNIPLLTEPSDENIPQANPDDVYKVIFEDLQYASQYIPASAYPKSQAASNDGHITKYAAQALLARVYLFYTGYYGKEPQVDGITKTSVLQGLEDFIAVAETEGYGLVEEFRNLWPAASTSWESDGLGGYTEVTTYAGRGNKEVVLAQKFNYTSDYNGNADGNRWLVNMGLRNYMATAPYGRGWGGCTVNPAVFNAYGNGDSRRDASIINIVSEGIKDNPDYESSYKDQREYTGYAVKKYTPMSKWVKDETSGTWSLTDEITGLGSGGDFQISQYQDFIVMRYSDVLLMAAELGSPNAQTYFNKVRERAYTAQNDEGTLELSSYYTEVSATKENIIKERLLEFAFEGQRYWDLLRQGVEYAASQIAGSTNVESGGNPDVVSITAENIINKKGLSQIPANQITQSNGVLQQNTGW